MNIKNLFTLYLFIVAIGVSIISTGCRGQEQEQEAMQDEEITWNTVQDTTQLVATIEGGLKGPEAAQYDAEQDVYFISNFNGNAGEPDSNAFISRAQPDGTIDSLKFMTGTQENPFHAGRGMYIIGDTLFVADLNGIHGFDRRSGQHLSFTDFTEFEPGFLNDIAIGPDSALYITDTGKPQLYRMSGQNVTISVDSLPYTNNGIIYDEANERLVMGPWNEGQKFLTWDPVNKTLGDAGSGINGLYDGIEFIGDDFIVSSQVDSSLQRIKDGKGQVFAKLPGKPADIGFDSKRRQVAVPIVALNKVYIWQLPEEE